MIFIYDYIKDCNGGIAKNSDNRAEIKKLKGADSINNTSEIRGTKIIVKKGSILR